MSVLDLLKVCTTAFARTDLDPIESFEVEPLKPPCSKTLGHAMLKRVKPSIPEAVLVFGPDGFVIMPRSLQYDGEPLPVLSVCIPSYYGENGQVQMSSGIARVHEKGIYKGGVLYTELGLCPEFKQGTTQFLGKWLEIPGQDAMLMELAEIWAETWKSARRKTEKKSHICWAATGEELAEMEADSATQEAIPDSVYEEAPYVHVGAATAVPAFP